MSSKILVDELAGKTTANDITVTVGASATMSLEQGLAKCWVNLTGTGTIATNDSFNVASLTDVSAGRYDVNYTNNMNNALYATQVCSDANTTNDAFNRTASGSTTTAKAFLMHFESNSSADTATMIGTINGDLA